MSDEPSLEQRDHPEDGRIAVHLGFVACEPSAAHPDPWHIVALAGRRRAEYAES